MWGWNWLENLLRDLRYGLRMLRKNPGFTTAAVLTLALGIGGNVAVFSLLETVMLRPFAYSHPERLWLLFRTHLSSHDADAETSYPDFQDLSEQSHAFSAMAGYYEDSFNLTGTASPERLDGLASTPGLFSLLGVPPVLGREFGPQDDPHVALLSYEFWQRRFGGDAEIIGKLTHLDGSAYTVMGILPPHFHFPPGRWGSDPEVFVPFTPNPQRGEHYLRVIARLAPAATAQQAKAEMDGIAARLAKAYPRTNGNQGIGIEQITEFFVARARQTIWILFGAVVFVLLIACSNVANLLLSRGGARERELAIRISVGATRWRIVRQLLTECLLLAGLGGALGVGLGYWMFPLLGSAVPQHSYFATRVRDAGLALNSTVLIFTVLLCASSCALFGLLPAWRYSRPARSSDTSLRPGRAGGSLISLEVALSFVLLAGAGLMMKSLVRLLETDVGFRTEHLLTMNVSLAGDKYASDESKSAFYQKVLERLESLRSVSSAAATVDLPMTLSCRIDGVKVLGDRPREGVVAYNSVSPSYFQAMGIPLLNGREFGASDSAHSPPVAVINRRMAEEYWPNENPIGKAIIAYRSVVVSNSKGSSDEFRPRELAIVGIVGNARQLGLDEPPYPEIFMPYSQWPSNEMTLVLRTASQPLALVPSVKKEIWRVDPDQPATDIKTMDDLISAEASGRRFVLELIGVFAAIALALAVVGIYGVISYSLRQRTHELGIRMALGATGSRILWLVAGENAGWLLAGIAAGLAAALALTRLLAAYLYGVRPTDPLTFVGSALLLFAVALLALYIPARRATKVDPMVALRYE
jgi:putative ABC transport system permease protein